MANAVVAEIGPRRRVVRLEALCAVGRCIRIISGVRAIVARIVVAIVVPVSAAIVAAECRSRDRPGRQSVTGTPITSVPSVTGTADTADTARTTDTADTARTARTARTANTTDAAAAATDTTATTTAATAPTVETHGLSSRGNGVGQAQPHPERDRMGRAREAERSCSKQRGSEDFWSDLHL
jgi:hypothetical protein